MDQILITRNPFKGADCRRVECVVCRDKPAQNKTTNCNKKGLVYSAKCETCHMLWKETHNETQDEERCAEVVPTYIGETSKSLFIRGGQHVDKFKKLSKRKRNFN